MEWNATGRNSSPYRQARVHVSALGVCAGVCYHRVDVSGAMPFKDMGTYTKLAELTHGDRPVYGRANSTKTYLFYSPKISKWIIGSEGSTSAGAGVMSDSTDTLCPDQATGWRAWNGHAFVDTYGITVAAASEGPPLLRLRASHQRTENVQASH